MSVRVNDYSTETGLRVRITSGATGTTIHIPADEWQEFLADAKAGAFDRLAHEPIIPFIY